MVKLLITEMYEKYDAWGRAQGADPKKVERNQMIFAFTIVAILLYIFHF